MYQLKALHRTRVFSMKIVNFMFVLVLKKCELFIGALGLLKMMVRLEYEFIKS